VTLTVSNGRPGNGVLRHEFVGAHHGHADGTERYVQFHCKGHGLKQRGAPNLPCRICASPSTGPLQRWHVDLVTSRS